MGTSGSYIQLKNRGFTREELQKGMSMLTADKRETTPRLERMKEGWLNSLDPALQGTFRRMMNQIGDKQPEAAFQILDLLLSKDVQKDSELLTYDYGAPVHMDLLKSNKRERVLAPFDLPDGAHKERWGLNDHNYDQLQALIKQITVVDFPTPVHHELQELWLPYQQAQTQEEREKLVHDAYRTITMMLAES